MRGTLVRTYWSGGTLIRGGRTGSALGVAAAGGPAGVRTLSDVGRSAGAPSPPDPLAPLAALEGVGVAAAHARAALDGLLRHPAVRRRGGEVAARVAVVDARASALLAGADVDDPSDLVLQGALRTAAQVPGLAAIWRRSPPQALARLHVLAARGLAPDDSLGRLREDPEVTARTQQLLALTGAPTRAPAVLVAGLVHAELAVIEPFGSADSVVARAAERVVLVALGADVRAACPTAAGHLALRGQGATLLRAYASGRPDGVGAWLRHVGEAVAAAAEEGLRVAEEVAGDAAADPA
jgi:hypothetical protein